MNLFANILQGCRSTVMWKSVQKFAASQKPATLESLQTHPYLLRNLSTRRYLLQVSNKEGLLNIVCLGDTAGWVFNENFHFNNDKE